MALLLQQQNPEDDVAARVQASLPMALAMDPKAAALAGFAALMRQMTARNDSLREVLGGLHNRLGAVQRARRLTARPMELAQHQDARNAIARTGAKPYDRFSGGRTLQEAVEEMAAKRGPQALQSGAPPSLPSRGSTPLTEWVQMLENVIRSRQRLR